MRTWELRTTDYGSIDVQVAQRAAQEAIEALEKLKQDGKTRHYGVSNFSPAMMDVCESAGHLAAN